LRVTAGVTTLGAPHTKEEVSLSLINKEPSGSVVANVYVWSVSVQRLEPTIWSFDEFVRDKADTWATLNDHEFATVEASRTFAVDENGIVGKKVKGFPDFGHEMKQHWPFDPKCECYLQSKGLTTQTSTSTTARMARLHSPSLTPRRSSRARWTRVSISTCAARWSP
jgi:hypothetical protein